MGDYLAAVAVLLEQAVYQRSYCFLDLEVVFVIFVHAKQDLQLGFGHGS